jgi:hypothetical protein
VVAVEEDDDPTCFESLRSRRDAMDVCHVHVSRFRATVISSKPFTMQEFANGQLPEFDSDSEVNDIRKCNRLLHFARYTH